jgi:hypothetical protein
MSADKQYVVRIIEHGTGKVEYESKPTSRRRAERIEDGMSINLNHERFYTEIVEAA